MRAPTIDFDKEYRFYDGKTRLNGAELNRRMSSIHQRLTAMEQITYSFDGIALEVSNAGLERINQLIVPVLDDAQGKLDEIAGVASDAGDLLDQLQAAGVVAANVELADISGVDADNVQAAIAEMHGAIEATNDAIGVVNGALGDAVDDISSLGSAALRDESYFATPADIAASGHQIGDYAHSLRNLGPKYIESGKTYLQSAYPDLFSLVGLVPIADGVTWTAQTSGFGSDDIYTVAYGDGLWIAAGPGGELATSPDGVTWTAQTSGFGSNAINAVAYGGGQWIAVGDSGFARGSPDGVTWTNQTGGLGFGSGVDINTVAYGDGLWIVAGTSGKLATSPDGVTWTAQTSGFGSNSINAVAYGGGQWIAAGWSGELATSPDGVTWTAQTSGMGHIYTVAYGDGQWIAAGTNGELATSPDGVTWTAQTSGFGSNAINAVAYGGGLWIAAGRNGKLATSPDGVTWTAQTSGIGSDDINAVAYGSGLWIAVGEGGKLATMSIYGYDHETEFFIPDIPGAYMRAL